MFNGLLPEKNHIMFIMLSLGIHSRLLYDSGRRRGPDKKCARARSRKTRSSLAVRSVRRVSGPRGHVSPSRSPRAGLAESDFSKNCPSK